MEKRSYRAREGDPPSSDSLPPWPRPNLFQVSRVGGGCQSTQAIFCYFPRHVSREQERALTQDVSSLLHCTTASAPTLPLLQSPFLFSYLHQVSSLCSVGSVLPRASLLVSHHYFCLLLHVSYLVASGPSRQGRKECGVVEAVGNRKLMPRV